MTTVTESWRRIDGWLARYAPDDAALLAPPADPAEIVAAEATLGLSFPPELVESLRRHNGLVEWANMFPERVPLSVARIVEHRQMCMEIDEFDDDDEAFAEAGFPPEERDDEPWWHELWLPFAESDGDSQVIDLRPGPGYGRLGWAIHDDRGTFDGAWPSLGAYLAETAEVLASGGEVRRRVPYLTVDNRLWWGLAGETELHGRPLRPAPTGLPTAS
ncbi:SMI1/KNR4 family protein [Plantactinospora solaniradicis]|uniref:SMI1/KNR4 family protein n=1 Tax=Plantactinospora solaniradicis TaxID=1723736 RepID=A0ABW1K078_9ACTN